MALAEAQLDPAGMAALRDEIDDAEAHNAARDVFAFMPAKDIDAAVGRPGPKEGGAGKRVKAIRKTARDETLAERNKDPAGWAMRDETVTAAYAEAEQADRCFQRAHCLTLATEITYNQHRY